MAKNLQISLIILGILIGFYFINNSSQSKLVTKSEPIFTGNSEDIYKFLIQNGKEAIELSRLDTVWKISGNDTLSIKTRSMDNMFDKILKVNKGTVISENPDKYSKYSIDDSAGTHLAVIDEKGETIAYYIFGRSKTDYSRSYIRISEDPKVYLADQSVTYMLSTQETYWGEKPKEEISPPPAVEIDTSNIQIN